MRGDKEQVNQTPINSVEDLKNKTRDACRFVIPEMLSAKRSFWARLQINKNSGRQHFQHLLH